MCPACCSSGRPSWATEKCQYVSTDTNRQRTYLCPEWTETNSLKHLPPCQILIEGLLPDVDLKLKLPERNGESRRYVWFKKGGQSIEFPSFNIDLEDINMGMSYVTAINRYSRLLRQKQTIKLHERLEGIHGWCVVRTMLVGAR